MCSSWRKLYQESFNKISTQTFGTGFEVMKRRNESLSMFITPAGLLEHQRSKIATQEVKNAVLQALVSIFRNDRNLRDCVGILLLLVMWPALSAIYWKFKFIFEFEEDATGEISGAFFDQLNRIRIENHGSIAATIKMNVFRTVWENRLRLSRDNDRIEKLFVMAKALAEQLPFDDDDEPQVSAQIAWKALSGNSDYDPEDQELSPLRNQLASEIYLSTDDIDLLILKNLCHRSWEEIAVRQGVKPETARKRHQRLIDKIKFDPKIKNIVPIYE